jgi:hypothetical protein
MRVKSGGTAVGTRQADWTGLGNGKVMVYVCDRNGHQHKALFGGGDYRDETWRGVSESRERVLCWFLRIRRCEEIIISMRTEVVMECGSCNLRSWFLCALRAAC